MQSKFSVQLDPRFPLLLLVVDPPLKPLLDGPDELPDEDVDELDVDPPGPSPFVVVVQAEKAARGRTSAIVDFMEGRLPC